MKTANITDLKKLYLAWKEQRCLKEYCRKKYRALFRVRRFNTLLAGLFMLCFIFAKAADFRQALWFSAAAGAVFLAAIHYRNKRELQRLIAGCKQDLADLEYKKRLDRASQREVLAAIGERLQAKYQFKKPRLTGEELTGIYMRDKTKVIFYFLGEEDLVSSKDLLVKLRECRREGIRKVRVFTNGNFPDQLKGLGERYDLDLKLYNGKKLKMLLAETPFYPTVAETEVLLKQDTEKTRIRATLYKKQVIQRGKTGSYFLYGSLLLAAACFRIGYATVNGIFGMVLIVLALLSFLHKAEETEKEFIF